MSHVNHKICAAGLCNFADSSEIYDSRVGGGTCNNHFRLELNCPSFKLIIVNEAFVIDTVRLKFIELAAHIDRRAVRKVTAVGKVHAHYKVTGVKKSGIHCHVCLSTGMCLNIGKIGSEKLLCPLYRKVFNNVNAFAAAVIPFAGVALCIFIGQNAAHCSHNCGRH